MANSEHVERLKHSVDEWNQWRKLHPNILPDLCDVNVRDYNLSGADLSFVNLRDANLSGCSLQGANLYMAVLSGAKLSRVNLIDANLHHTHIRNTGLSHAKLIRANLNGADLSCTHLNNADLSYANLSYANLSRADFNSADLNGANFSHANLSHTNFHKVHFSSTLFAWVDLSDVKGLVTAIYHASSSADINSVIFPFDEHTRQHFLRGIGFSERFIDYQSSLLITQSHYYSLFISYSSADEYIAQRLHTDLQAKGVQCWFAPHDLRPGMPIVRGIEEAIQQHEKLLLILTERAVKSSWVEKEVDVALYQEIKSGQNMLFPIRFDNTVLESTAGWARCLQHRHIGDFTQWQEEGAYQHAFTTLLRHLKINISSTLKYSP